MPLCLLVLAPPAVSVNSLLSQMVSFDHLTRPPVPAYTAAQASSYDRASNPGPNSDLFANGDAGKFLRVESREGRKEYVMADLKGPGAVVRVWTANPTGTLRFYFDGEAKPRLEAKTEALLTGGDPRFPDPFAYVAARGGNLYFPIPYAKSLKVTVDDSDGANAPLGFYYHVGYRTYASGTDVQTFTPEDALRTRTSRVAARLKVRQPLPMGGRRLFAPSRGTVTIGRADGAGRVHTFAVRIPFPLKHTVAPMTWDDPAQPHNVLRNLILKVEADGRPTIEAPLGDFFGTAAGLNAYATLPFQIRDGWMVCRLPMPYAKGIRATVTNLSRERVPLDVVFASRAGRAEPYRLYAQWTVDEGPSRPFKDMTFLDVRGEGYWLGSSLHVANPDPAWWGEGDEKVTVDGEPSPSTFGTGTEDYYGYAWCSPELFARPYHAQPRCDGPGNFGHTLVNRFHVLDPIPYTQSLHFDMERWHWKNVPTAFARVAYWYAKPGGTGPVAVDRRRLAVPEIRPPEPVEGAIEGETLRVAAKTGGTVEAQGGFFELSGGRQLWWKNVAKGDRLSIEIPVKEAGEYEIVANLCHARDYGIHRLKVAGIDLGRHDFYSPNLEWKRVSFGRHRLPAGTVSLEVECLGRNPAAVADRMFGLDFLLLRSR